MIGLMIEPSCLQQQEISSDATPTDTKFGSHCVHSFVEIFQCVLFAELFDWELAGFLELDQERDELEDEYQS